MTVGGGLLWSNEEHGKEREGADVRASLELDHEPGLVGPIH